MRLDVQQEGAQQKCDKQSENQSDYTDKNHGKRHVGEPPHNAACDKVIRFHQTRRNHISEYTEACTENAKNTYGQPFLCFFAERRNKAAAAYKLSGTQTHCHEE